MKNLTIQLFSSTFFFLTSSCLYCSNCAYSQDVDSTIIVSDSISDNFTNSTLLFDSKVIVDLIQTPPVFVMYPNPTFEKLTITVSDGDLIESVIVSSREGNPVFRLMPNKVTGVILELSELNSGEYYVDVNGHRYLIKKE